MKTKGENENKEIGKETYDGRMKGEVDEPYGNRMRDTCTMKGSFFNKVKIAKFNGTDVKTWLS